MSLVSTLVAVAIGAIVASLIASVISDAVRGQRAIIDRDEFSEFALFMKGLVTADSTCRTVMAGKSFAAGGATNLSIGPVSYGDQAGINLQNGFEFANKSMRITNLTLEDSGLAPTNFSVPITDPVTGTVTQVNVNRYIARIRLNVQHVNGTVYRPRYFEFPVLVDGGGVVRDCNNELNISDACVALGYTYDTSTTPPTCVPKGACSSGGSYGVGGYTPYANPATGGFSCPAGYQALPSGAVGIYQFCAKGCDFLSYTTVVQCVRCAP